MYTQIMVHMYRYALARYQNIRTYTARKIDLKCGTKRCELNYAKIIKVAYSEKLITDDVQGAYSSLYGGIGRS